MKRAGNRQDRTQSVYGTVAGVVLLLTVGILVSIVSERGYRQRAVRQADVNASVLAQGVSAALTFHDTPGIERYVMALGADPNVAAAAVYDESGRLVVSLDRSRPVPPLRAPPPGARYQPGGATASTVVQEQGTALGSVFLQYRPERPRDLIERHGALALLMLMALLLLSAAGRATSALRRHAAELGATNAQLGHEMEERAKVEEALRQSQKMESLGQLTGGVAHDFNNLLTIILGGLDIIGRQLASLPEDAQPAKMRRAQLMATDGAERAATLTKRLLAFSRRQPLEPIVIDPNKMVGGMAELLRRTLGEQVELEIVLGAGLWRTRADPSQLENALLNLAVNARDAMQQGGRLTLETANASLDEAYVDGLDETLPAGQYVLIAVTDTGRGMDADTLSRVFEPFFTTKEVGKGTGLGLSQVYGFLRQSDGHVRIYSEIGEGTTVKIYLPRVLADVAPKRVVERQDPATITGDEVILLVEDHNELRAHSSGILRDLGYTVIEAADANEAQELFSKNPTVAMLFTDVVLPGAMNGRHLADALCALRPLPVLFTSGYTRNAIVHNGVLDTGVHLISKPFSADELGRKVRSVLDEFVRPSRGD